MTITRREFLERSTSCAAHVALAGAVAPPLWREAWARSSAASVVAREPFGTLERVADGVWALISTPLGGDRTTLSNGGLVAGRSGVLAIEGFFQPAGAQWLATRSRELTGRWPTHVAVTHYHSDHANGVAGYANGGSAPRIRATGTTRDLAVAKNTTADPASIAALGDAVLLPAGESTTLDLGGRVVRIVPRRGHTESDISLELDDPSVVFPGDLVWNGMVPNYVDAIPSALAQSVRALPRSPGTVIVPGHGALAQTSDLERYQALLEEIERAARLAHAQGVSAADAGARYALPGALGEWVLFNKVFFERAFAAWYRELGGG